MKDNEKNDKSLQEDEIINRQRAHEPEDDTKEPSDILKYCAGSLNNTTGGGTRVIRSTRGLGG